MKKFAVILAGCGVFDGSEIHEATLTLLAIQKKGSEYQCFAPNIDQHHVINHITGEEMQQTRNVLIESARIARGNIKDISELNVDDYDGIIFPGGFGVAKNLSDFAFKGAEIAVLPSVSETILAFWKAKKPIGALCISPAIIAKVIPNATLTIGSDAGTKDAIEKMGAKHKQTTHGEVVTDAENKIVTTPCYMLDANIAQIEEGANNLVDQIHQL
ncbi:isoprenoid biosynthesis glyoxalase ElbB [Plebeiibacterium sediminum]|uniref:Isoprenoid biosynthesis glyoxalase ElbB n=1 Tax=Plebeiibacterium sediminum TaxID=2992112 RepID=A0AAE3M7V5_9BACT|nr:isoprenoid biosynthesis glyoxalase ElbB [Plebeiobacterium sediminum]MCW3788562.1 isoprenoid biosynthesis glyoxalase ElbB [Plebeiobacterium sediminum]